MIWVISSDQFVNTTSTSVLTCVFIVKCKLYDLRTLCTMDDHEFKSQEILTVLTESCSGKYYLETVEIVGYVPILKKLGTPTLKWDIPWTRNQRFSYCDTAIARDG